MGSRSGRGDVIDDAPRCIQIIDNRADEFDLLVHLVEDHELGFHRGAEFAVNVAGDREREARLCDG